ncbi:hypothetical protein [Geobacter sp.]|uniref:hypothetical protein n=1 Tax=Geobacter sp. TaxID=46610 RepID=UPI002603F7C7|nr:hypothetical protein [Geobacter sp.]
MELVIVLIALAVMVFGGKAVPKAFRESPTVHFIQEAPRRFGIGRVIAAGVLVVIILYHLTN